MSHAIPTAREYYANHPEATARSISGYGPNPQTKQAKKSTPTTTKNPKDSK